MRETLAALRRLELGLDEAALVELAARRIPQSRLFMADLLPVIHGLFEDAPPDHRIRVLDVGAETGAGAALLADLHHPDGHAYLKMHVAAVDVDPRHAPVARGLFPDVDHRVADAWTLAAPDPPWDLVIASHVVEHVPDADGFVAHLRRVARGGVLLVAAPFEEDPRIPEHLHTIDGARIEAWGPTSWHVYTNVNWRWHGRCFVAAFDLRDAGR